MTRAPTRAVWLLALSACSTDLFHPTNWDTACDDHPARAGCPGAATSSATTTSTTASTTGSGGSGGSGGAGGDGGAGGGLPCDAPEGCTTCRVCALEDTCAEVAAACEGDDACRDLLACAVDCGDDTSCADGCLVQHPDGAALYGPVFECQTCTACPDLCAGSCP